MEGYLGEPTLIERNVIELPRVPSCPDFAVSSTGRCVFVAGIGIFNAETQSVDAEINFLQNCTFCRDERSAYGIVEEKLFWIDFSGTALQTRCIDELNAASAILAVFDDNTVVWCRESNSGNCEVVHSASHAKSRILYTLDDGEYLPDQFSKKSSNWLLTCSHSAIADYPDVVRDLQSGELVCKCPRAFQILPDIKRFISQSYFDESATSFDAAESHFSDLIEEYCVEYALCDFSGRRLCRHDFPIGTLVSVRTSSDQSFWFLEGRITSGRRKVLGLESVSGARRLVSENYNSFFASQRYIFMLDRQPVVSQLQVLDRDNLRVIQVFPNFVNDICITTQDESKSFFLSQDKRTIDVITHRL
jgi:hypothetical protein